MAEATPDFKRALGLEEILQSELQVALTSLERRLAGRAFVLVTLRQLRDVYRIGLAGCDNVCHWYAVRGLGEVQFLVGIACQSELSEGMVQPIKDNPTWLDPHVELASLYYKLHRPQDGAREREIVERLTGEQQAHGPK